MMLFSAARMYAALYLLTVTIRISVPSPTMLNPKAYGLATCSGVFISPDEILTAAHCIDHSRGKQWIKTSDGKSYVADVESKDVLKDLALLRVRHIPAHQYTRIGASSHITENVYTVNSSEGWEGTYSQGVINNFIDDEDTGVWTVLHTAPILQGASGSGLFNERGELIGINTAVLKNFSSAVDITVIDQFLHKRQ